MSTSIDALRLRREFGRKDWLPPEPFGPDGWRMVARDRRSSVIVTAADQDGYEWWHASIAHVDHVPTYGELAALHRAVWGATKGGTACQAFVPPADHVNIHEYALHLWGRANGESLLPDFGAAGTI